jgi:GxxExxY protein
MRDELRYERTTGAVIGAFFEVYNTLKGRYNETVYRNALAVELQLRGIPHVVEHPLDVRYKGQVVGSYRADLLVEACVIVELKAGLSLDPNAFAQLTNYLRVTGYRVGLLLYFGPTPTFHRVVNDA